MSSANVTTARKGDTPTLTEQLVSASGSLTTIPSGSTVSLTFERVEPIDGAQFQRTGVYTAGQVEVTYSVPSDDPDIMGVAAIAFFKYQMTVTAPNGSTATSELAYLLVKPIGVA